MAHAMVAEAGLVLVLAMIPGPTTAVMVRQMLRGGPRTALATVAGAQVALLFWSLATALGFSALVAASQVAYDALRLVGAVVLVSLGVASLRRGRRPPGAAELRVPVVAAPWRGFRTGILTDLANPKIAVFALAFLPQFVPAHAPVLTTTLLLGLVWVAVDAAWYAVLIGLLTRSRTLLSALRARHHLERVTGAVLVALGIWVAVERR
ncbi:MAG: LysE family translocator [Acidimicrobiales bacterium]